jgi:hypothetical protein
MLLNEIIIKFVKIKIIPINVIVLTPFLSKFALEYNINKIQENLERITINGDHQRLVCAQDVNLLSENMTTGIKAAGVQINAEGTK